MKRNTRQSKGEFRFNTKGLQEQTLQHAELLQRQAQLQNFAPIRERLVAAGKDPNAAYKRIFARRNDLAAKLVKLAPAPATAKAVKKVSAASKVTAVNSSLLMRPIAPPRWIPPWWGIGYSGTVQMGQASQGISYNASGQYPSTGTISTVSYGPTGQVSFDGDLEVGPDESYNYDPDELYFWQNTWNNMILFPAPTSESSFSYSFAVYANVPIFLLSPNVTLYVFVSTGHVANYTGQAVPIDTPGPFPIFWDLSQSTTSNGLYNGHYGYIEGHAIVSGGFTVGAGQKPAVSVAIGVICGQAMMSGVRLDFPGLGTGSVAPMDPTLSNVGQVNFTYQPSLVVIGHL